MMVLAVVAACGGDEGVCTPPAGQGFDWQSKCKTVNCEGAASCDIACAAGMTCGTLDCKGAQQCRYDCQANATCPLTDCRDTGSCGGPCADRATCEGEGDQSLGCDLACTGGAECLLRCGTSSACKFGACTGGTGMTDCGGGVLVCNRPCP